MVETVAGDQLYAFSLIEICGALSEVKLSLETWVLCWYVKYKNSLLFEFTGCVQQERIARKHKHFGPLSGGAECD